MTSRTDEQDITETINSGADEITAQNQEVALAQKEASAQENRFCIASFNGAVDVI